MIHWLGRQLYLIDYTVSSLSRRKAKNLGLFTVYALVIFALASVMLFTQALKEEALRVLRGAPEITVQRIVMGRHDLIGADQLRVLRDIRGVAWAEGRLWGYFHDTANGANYTTMAPGGDGDRSGFGRPVSDGEVRVGAGVARERGVGKDDWLFLLSLSGQLFKLKVVEVLPDTSELVSTDLVLLSPGDYRAFHGLPEGVFTDIAMRVRNPREITKIVEKASLALPDCRFITLRDLLRTYDAIFDWRGGILLVFLSGAILAFILLAWDRASGLSAEERREIGILKAVGWETGDIIRARLWEGGLVSLGAFLVGYVAAYLHVFFFSAGILAPVLQGWAVIYPDFQLAPRVDGARIFALLFFTVVPYTAAILVPIWRSAIIDPDSAMR